MLDRGLDPNFHDLETGGRAGWRDLGKPLKSVGSERRGDAVVQTPQAASAFTGS